MRKMTLQGNTLTIRTGLWKQLSFALDTLRYICLLCPGDLLGSNHVRNARELQAVQLDFLPETIVSRVFQRLTELLNTEKRAVLKQITFCFADYNNRTVMLSGNDLKQIGRDLFEMLLVYREDRLDRLNAWITEQPNMTIPGPWGHKAVLTQAGFRNGSNELIVWQKVKKMSIEQQSFGRSTLYLFPKGVNKDTLSFKRYLYALRISTSQRNQVYAECHFWRNLSLQ